jgi:hypothetical protein
LPGAELVALAQFAGQTVAAAAVTDARESVRGRFARFAGRGDARKTEVADGKTPTCALLIPSRPANAPALANSRYELTGVVLIACVPVSGCAALAVISVPVPNGTGYRRLPRFSPSREWATSSTLSARAWANRAERPAGPAAELAFSPASGKILDH